MSITNWTTRPSTQADQGFAINLVWFVDENHDPIQAGDDTIVKQIRIAVSGTVEADANATHQRKTAIYRVAGSSLPHDGAADGSSPLTPAPITTGTAGDLTALQTVISRLKKQFRLDANGDVEP